MESKVTSRQLFGGKTAQLFDELEQAQNTLLNVKKDDTITLIDNNLGIKKECRVAKISKAGKIELEGKEVMLLDELEQTREPHIILISYRWYERLLEKVLRKVFGF